ncbi:hypothetical protein LZU85_20205 [Vibrio sp. IRLE0018]|uniref:hypothetical protein n=1 Tax=Vibrio TaxID=662 RepID=UPI000586B4A3|nr:MULTISPECIES: hypothetical protein [Vibrio]MCF8781123.1 hypothetical protein [Vibrio floridensis]
MNDEIEEVVEDLEQSVEYSLEDNTKSSCRITKVTKKGLYYTAHATCSDGRKVKGTSSNINVAKGLACNKCG